MSQIPIKIEYYNTSSWTDITQYVTGWKAEDHGVSRVKSAVFNVETQRSNISSLLSNVHRLIRIRINPGAWQTVFYGYIDNAYYKTIPGVIEDRIKANFNGLGAEDRLATDYITRDYYKLQSAMAPYTGENSWTYRKVIQDMLDYPDSRISGFWDYPTGFTLQAAENPNGIDHIIDSSCSFNAETIFSAIRTILDRIGYDGCCRIVNEDTSPQPQLIIAPYDKAHVYTFTSPFKGEVEYYSGSLSDVYNFIFPWGGVDTGVPADNDRFTELVMAKYSPDIWTGEIYNKSQADGGVYVTAGGANDVNNNVFSENYRTGVWCLRALAHNSSNRCLRLKLTLPTPINMVDRITQIFHTIKFYSSVLYTPWYLRVYLQDSSGGVVYRQVSNPNPPIPQQITWIRNQEGTVSVSAGPNTANQWTQLAGAEFDWSSIASYTVESSYGLNVKDDFDWGFYVDGLQFCGGLKIEPLLPHSAVYNPPAVDQASINSHGLRVLNHKDPDISSFEHAQMEAQRLLSSLKNPVSMLTLPSNPPAVQLYPGDVVLANLNYYRVAGINYDWMNTDKVTRAVYKLTGKTSPLPPIWTQDAVQKYMSK
jgi:hypothetical protein